MMDTIHIVTSTSVQARRNTLSFLGSGLFVPTSVKINYNLVKGLPPVHMVDSYPLIIKGTLCNISTAIAVYHLSAGFNGPGSRDLLEILRFMNFKICDDVILSDHFVKRNKISLTILKDGTIL